MWAYVDRCVRFLEEVCGAAALAIMFAAIVIQVFWRYLFVPLIWPFELSIYMYICLIYLGAALAGRHDSHVAFDVIFNMLPGRLQRIVSAALRLFGGAVLAALVWPGIRFMVQSHHLHSASLHIPWSFLVFVYLVGILLLIGHLLAGALSDWRSLRNGGS
jgi:TRAP-type C4-dicarboxylate transport system permease small subunit